ncbi:hypothetical protein LEL_10977 [Akanthomyces lecanii RCEF 1005]|uniref:Uncharacterized protein n=1 Tax=Akanthomyces lecanii RCEF 1005 TaxID=1081108 RepID=A0A167NV19_CORDF|nr:hypothetical protein LEL_10977 [Akanthomyces lecanii RCEF 1005]
MNQNGSKYDPSTAPEVAYHNAPELGPNNESRTGSDPRPVGKSLEQLFKVFWGVIVTTLIVLAALGGGIGGGLAANSHKSPPDLVSSAPTPTSTSASTSSSSSISTSATPTVTTSCNASDSTFYTPLNQASSNRPYSINGTTLSYQIHCFKNFAASGSGHNPNINTLEETPNLSTLEACITACASYNLAFAAGNPNPSYSELCSGVIYVATDTPPTCYLNSGKNGDAVSVTFQPRQEIDSAVLAWGS